MSNEIQEAVFHRAFHHEPPLPADAHQRNARVMLDVVEHEPNGVYRSHTRTHKSKRERLGWLIEPPQLYRCSPTAVIASATGSSTHATPTPTSAEIIHTPSPPRSSTTPSRLVHVIEINLLLEIGLDSEHAARLLRNAHQP
jgi:hypothetical protein